MLRPRSRRWVGALADRYSIGQFAIFLDFIKIVENNSVPFMELYRCVSASMCKMTEFKPNQSSLSIIKRNLIRLGLYPFADGSREVPEAE